MRRPRSAASGVILALAAAAAVWGLLGDSGVGEPGGARTSPTSGPAAGASAPASDPASGLPVVRVEGLPAEALDTLRLIELGGPFPEDEDGSRFGNYEGILPDQPLGCYAEYTVDTPGVGHRGARRIVVGDGGEFYYTDDHYVSFVRIDGWPQ